MAPATDVSFALARLEDAVASLRTWLAVVGLLAVVALGASIYALTREDDASNGSRRGLASDERVSRLDDRVDRLSRQLQGVRASGAASKDDADTTALGDRIDELEKTVQQLSDRPATDATQAVEELSGRIDDLAQDVEQLKQAQTTP